MERTKFFKPEGTARLKDGRLFTLDGFKISYNEENIPFIDDKKAGKYNGYTTYDYFTKVVKPYHEKKKK